MSMMGDPWEDVPEDRRLEFKVIREPLERLTAAVVINVERSLPPAIANVVGAPMIFLLLSKLAETTFNTIRYFCADEPQDPRRQISFASSAPPLLRALLDEIFTVIFIGEDVAGRVQWRSEEHTSELQSRPHLVCRLLLEKKKTNSIHASFDNKKKKETIENEK